MAPALWINYTKYSRAHLFWAKLETDFGQAGGASTYLQLVNMVKIEFTNSTELLPQILENYNRITSNGHSKLSEDLATFMICSSLPTSYEQTAQQYLDEISAISGYKIQDIVAQVLQEESTRKAQSIQTGTSINKFSTMKNYGQKCAKCGKTNHSTQNHWPGGKNMNKSSGGHASSSKSSKGKGKPKKAKGKGKEKATASSSANVLDMGEILELSIITMNNINFSCYNWSETVEWFFDSGSTEHITPVKSNFVQYREFAQP